MHQNQHLVFISKFFQELFHRDIVMFKNTFCICSTEKYILYILPIRDTKEFESSFQFACPKFLSPVPPNYDAPQTNYHKEPFLLQSKVFLDEVNQQRLLATIRRWVMFDQGLGYPCTSKAYLGYWPVLFRYLLSAFKIKIYVTSKISKHNF